MKATTTGAYASVWLGLAAVFTFTGAVRATAAGVEVGQPAPAFQLPDENGKIHSLADYTGKILILAFYPKDFTGG
jgi:peroxiredoxin Q/BCP